MATSNAKSFEDKVRAAAKAARAFKEELDGTEYVAVLQDGRRLSIPLTMNLTEAEEWAALFDGGTEPTNSEILGFIGKLTSAETVDEIKGLPVELASAVIGGWGKAFAIWQGLDAGE